MVYNTYYLTNIFVFSKLKNIKTKFYLKLVLISEHYINRLLNSKYKSILDRYFKLTDK